MIPSIRHRFHTPRNGFSLVEVTIALGILVFCMVPIMGLIPIALKISRQSMDRNIQTRITQTVRAQLLNEPFSTLGTSTNFYFDEEGMALAPGASEFQYQVTATIQTNADLPASQTARYLALSKLDIVDAKRHQTNHSTIYLPDNGF